MYWSFAFIAIFLNVPGLGGVNSSTKNRIAGGSLVEISKVPYQVALLQKYNKDLFKLACGGTILSVDTILTAAHCTVGTSAFEWRIRAGSRYHNEGGNVVNVKSIIQHPQYTKNFDYDIAILKLEKYLVFGSEINYAPLPAQGSPVPDASLAYVSGWGVDKDGGEFSTDLQLVTIPTVNHLVCQQAYASYNPVTDRMVCAGDLGVGGKDACYGDSGGPMIVAGYVVGISSWARGCAQPQYPGVYTKVSEFRNWINNYTRVM